MNRPFGTWSALEDENKMFVRAVFYDENNIVPLIYTDDMHKSEELFARYVRDIKQVNNTNYNIDIENLTCTCKNWQLTRSMFASDDPRRLCKHLIRELDIENIDDKIRRYKQEIEFYKNEDRGFFDNFNTIIDIENTSHKLLYKYSFDWMSLFDIDGTLYGIMVDEYGKIIWSNKYGKPHDHEKVETFLLNIPSIVYKEDTYEDENYDLYDNNDSEENSICSNFYEEAENYYYGINGYDEDYGLALIHYELAVEESCMLAYEKIGLIYKNGEGIDVDVEKALESFVTGAHYGHIDCYAQIAIIFSEMNNLDIALDNWSEYFTLTDKVNYLHSYWYIIFIKKNNLELDYLDIMSDVREQIIDFAENMLNYADSEESKNLYLKDIEFINANL